MIRTTSLVSRDLATRLCYYVLYSYTDIRIADSASSYIRLMFICDSRVQTVASYSYFTLA